VVTIIMTQDMDAGLASDPLPKRPVCPIAPCHVRIGYKHMNIILTLALLIDGLLSAWTQHGLLTSSVGSLQ